MHTRSNRKAYYWSLVLLLFALCLSGTGCQTTSDVVSDSDCRPAGRITTGTGLYDVPILLPKRGRLTPAEEDSLLANFNFEARNIAPIYCFNHSPGCAWEYRPATRTDIKLRKNYQFTTPQWRTLPPSPAGNHRLNVWAVEPSQNNVACKQVVTISLPPPRRISPGPLPTTPSEIPCNPPNPAWNKTPGLYGGRVGAEVDPLDSVETVEERLFTAKRDELIAQWEAEIAAACKQSNPGTQCQGKFNVDPDITYDRHAMQRNASTGRDRVIIELRLRNNVNGVCE